jgi:hypothetical protein
MDPASKYATKLKMLQNLLSNSINEVEVRKQIEELFTGNTSNTTVAQLYEKITLLKILEQDVKAQVLFL